MAIGVVLPLLLVACGDDGTASKTDKGVAMGIEVPTGVEFGRMAEHQELVDALSGGLTPTSRQVTIASCHNIADWLDDVTLDNEIVIATDEGLTRAAELAATDQVDLRLALVVEFQVWNGATPNLSGPLKDEGFTEADVEQYAELRQMPPSAASAERYLVYVVHRTTTAYYVMYVDTNEVSHDRVSGRFPSHTALVAKNGEAQAFEIREDSCASA